MQNCLSRKSSISRKYSKTFRPHHCLSHKSSISRKHSKTFSPAELSQQQIIDIPEIFKDFSRLQNCLSCKSSISRKFSKTFLPAEMSQLQFINILETSKDVFACRIVASSNHHYPAKIQRRFGLQNCLSCKSSISRKNLKDFSRLQNCLSRKSSLSRKYSKAFSPAEISQPQIINIPKILKDFSACIVVLAAIHQYPGKFRRLFRLPNCLRSKSLISRNYSKTFLAELSQPQIISIPKILEDLLAC